MKRAPLLILCYVIGFAALYLVGRQWKLKPETPANHTILKGETAVLTVANGNSVWLARDKDDCYSMQVAMSKNDTSHLKACEDNQTAFPVPAGSAVRVIAASVSRRQVQILEGPLAGRTGWVEHEFLRLPKPGEIR